MLSFQACAYTSRASVQSPALHGLAWAICVIQHAFWKELGLTFRLLAAKTYCKNCLALHIVTFSRKMCPLCSTFLEATLPNVKMHYAKLTVSDINAVGLPYCVHQCNRTVSCFIAPCQHTKRTRRMLSTLHKELQDPC